MELTFEEFSQKNPCIGCPAPCCQMQLIPHRTPATFMDIDFLRYMLLFPHTEVVVTLNGEWSILKWEQCSEFEDSSHTCKLHNTSDKPRTCVMYNPYNCWYKRAFVLNDSHQVYRLDLTRFNLWVTELQFSEDGKIISAPNFERSLEILKDIPIEPYLEALTTDAVESDPRDMIAERQSTVKSKNMG
jgi:hypothetical protein